MGFTAEFADTWDFVDYSKALDAWAEKVKREQSNANSDYEDGDTAPPSFEWMIADDIRQHEKGVRVH